MTGIGSSTYHNGRAIVIRADALSLPLPDNSVDLVVTSPPYWSLRSYTDGGQHYEGQLGSEATPQDFIVALVTATREMVRVLKPTGSIFVNLGDKYGDKSLLLLPERYRIACVDELGLVARAVICWSKVNGLPESVTDRVRRSHEDWVHFTLQPRYFSAVDEIREPHAPASLARYASSTDPIQSRKRYADAAPIGGGNAPLAGANPLGKLPGSVWEVPTEPLTVPAHLGVDHFAAFPTAWPRRLILGWSPSGICTACGSGHEPIVDAKPMVVRPSARRLEAQASGNAQRTSTSGTMLEPASRTILGYACPNGCDAPTRPSVVLDPFGGTGTTAAVASALGRIGISVDLSMDYARLAKWRVSDPGVRAKVLGLKKPPVEADGQEDLFGGELMPDPKRNVSVSLQGDRTCSACGYRSQYARKPACDRCGAPRQEGAA